MEALSPYQDPEGVWAWLDALKARTQAISESYLGKRIDFTFKAKETLRSPMLEFIFEHELMTAKRLNFDIFKGEEYLAAIVLRDGGGWEII